MKQLISGKKQRNNVSWRNRLGNTLMVAGAVSLGAFFLFKGWSAGQSAAGLEAFDQALADSAAVSKQAGPQFPADSPAVSQLVSPSVTPSLNASLNPAATPDQALWSAPRVKQYAQAKLKDDAVPQAVLNIVELDLRVPVFNGASDLNLNRGAARIIGTSRIGDPGNLAIAGHRDSFFRPLKDISLGDRLTLETHFGTAEYQVSSIEIVYPTALHVLAPTDASMVTLVTCYPFYHVGNAPQRFIVKAEALENQVNS